jgi:dihydropteroate synthase
MADLVARAAPAAPGVRDFGGRRFDLSRRVLVGAVVDVTPDSFHRPGTTFRFEDALAACRQAEAEGADWLDLGGVAYAPGAWVPAAEELDRLLPVVAAAAEQTGLVVSVDTMRADVAREVIAAGATIINDASGLKEPAIVEVAAETGAGLIVTHAGDGPGTASFRPAYADVSGEVVEFLRRQVQFCLDRGVRPEQLVVDPGIDLHKNTYHSLELVRRMDELAELGYPILAAVSNKDFIGESIGELRTEDRLEGSLATTVSCILQGARLVRAHDVRATVRTVRMTEVLLGMTPPALALHNLV